MCLVYLGTLVNSRYGANGIVVDDSIPIVLNALLEKYPKQCKYNGNTATYAPYCNLDTLSRAIKDSDVLRRVTPHDLIGHIDKYNNEYGWYLYNYDKDHYKKCHDKSEFYLPYKGANCSWFKELVKQYSL